MSDPTVHDEELEALMAELEAQNAEIVAASSAPKEPVDAPKEPVADANDEIAALEAEIAAAQETTAAAPASEPVVEPAEPTIESEPPPPFDVEESAKSEADVKEPVVERTEPKRPTETVTAGTAGPGNLQHYVDVDQFRADTRVTEANLDQCMIEQSGLRAYYGAIAARAEAQAARVKAKFEVVEATLYDHHRKALAATGEKVTEKMVENAVKLDPRWIKAKNTVIEAETIATINKSLVESLRDRKDMLVQLGADRREELKGSLRIMEERQEREELRDRALRAMQGARTA